MSIPTKASARAKTLRRDRVGTYRVELRDGEGEQRHTPALYWVITGVWQRASSIIPTWKSHEVAQEERVFRVLIGGGVSFACCGELLLVFITRMASPSLSYIFPYLSVSDRKDH